MGYRKLRVAAITAVIIGAACAYYFISKHAYLKAATAAFPGLPVDDCYYLPWPVGPRLIGEFLPDDTMYLRRDFIERDSQGMHLVIYDANGMFEVNAK